MRITGRTARSEAWRSFKDHDAERLNIERIAIIADELWPVSEVWPVKATNSAVAHEQHARGIWIEFSGEVGESRHRSWSPTLIIARLPEQSELGTEQSNADS